jgi:hypothetical protein
VEFCLFLANLKKSSKRKKYQKLSVKNVKDKSSWNLCGSLEHFPSSPCGQFFLKMLGWFAVGFFHQCSLKISVSSHTAHPVGVCGSSHQSFFELFFVIVHLHYCDRIPQTGWLINSRNVFIMVLQDGCLRWGWQYGRVLVRASWLLVISSRGRKL